MMVIVLQVLVSFSTCELVCWARAGVFWHGIVKLLDHFVFLWFLKEACILSGERTVGSDEVERRRMGSRTVKQSGGEAGG